jgi:hypothetical protein
MIQAKLKQLRGKVVEVRRGESYRTDTQKNHRISGVTMVPVDKLDLAERRSNWRLHEVNP